MENFNRNHRSRNDSNRGRNENYSKDDNFREKTEYQKHGDQNKIRNDQLRNWDEPYRGGNNRVRRGRGGPSVYFNSNLKQNPRSNE